MQYHIDIDALGRHPFGKEHIFMFVFVFVYYSILGPYFI